MNFKITHSPRALCVCLLWLLTCTPGCFWLTHGDAPLAGVPIFMFRLGSVEPRRLAGLKRGGQEPPSLHSAVYFPDADKTLTTGITAMATAVLDLLPPKK